MSSIANYSKLTEEELGKGLWEQINPDNRQYYVHTGAEGMRQFHRSMERVHIDTIIEHLTQQGRMKIHELASITKMLDSKDDRDYELAKIILNNKYELNI